METFLRNHLALSTPPSNLRFHPFRFFFAVIGRARINVDDNEQQREKESGSLQSPMRADNYNTNRRMDFPNHDDGGSAASLLSVGLGKGPTVVQCPPPSFEKCYYYDYARLALMVAATS